MLNIFFRRSAQHHFNVLGHWARQSADAINQVHLLVVQREP